MKRSAAKSKDSEAIPGLLEYSELLVRSALSEDLGPGDITTDAIVPAGAKGTAEFIAKESFTVAGLFLAEMVFKSLDGKARFTALARDGQTVKKGSVIATVEGGLRTILAGERVALNFLQRLSGIATQTAVFVKKTKGSKIKVLDTRKTTPCLRIVEKYAVKAGGGHNHRFGLYDCILIKDNHIAAAGGVSKAIGLVREKYGTERPVEVEVTDFKELKEALDSKAEIIMLDNMSVEKIKKARTVIGKKALVEVSGGVNLKTISSIARTGADFVSIGALTHSARSVDISLEVASLCREKTGRRK